MYDRGLGPLPRWASRPNTQRTNRLSVTVACLRTLRTWTASNAGLTSLVVSDLIIDPLVLTVSGCQEYCPELIEAVRTLQVVWDPPPAISVGLSNVSNAVPEENRSLINRVYCAMLMGAGLEMIIANPFDEPAHIIEVQCGDYLGEDDIVRIEDNYGREGTNT